MSIANLYNSPLDERALTQFSFSNQDEHFKIAAKIYRVFGINPQLYPLDPIPVFDMGAWLHTHQQAHNQQNQILGIVGNDLTGLNFRRRDQIAAWTNIHAQEHYLAAQILNLT